jgi:hypothetical protein
VIEGPFHDEHLIAGYTLIDVASREGAMDWSLRYAKTAVEDEDGEIEVRRCSISTSSSRARPFAGSGSSTWSAGSPPTWGGLDPTCPEPSPLTAP